MSLYVVMIYQIILLVYHQAIINLDLYPFNNIRNQTVSEKALISFSNGLCMSLPIGAYLLEWKLLMYMNIGLYGILLIKELRQNWWHYLFGANHSWMEKYEQNISNTLTILPSSPKNPAPNLAQSILLVWTGVCLIVNICFLFSL